VTEESVAWGERETVVVRRRGKGMGETEKTGEKWKRAPNTSTCKQSAKKAHKLPQVLSSEGKDSDSASEPSDLSSGTGMETSDLDLS